MKNNDIRKKNILYLTRIFWIILALCFAGLTGCRGRDVVFFSEEENTAEEAMTENSEEKPSEESSELPEGGAEHPAPAETVEQPEKIYVDVCGAVVNPGVYELDADSRVFQAIEAAGGYLPDAAENYVNRAEGLEDGRQIYVPTEEELAKGTVTAAASAAFSEKGAEAAKVNLNTADETALTTLTGIGSTRAQAIIAYREEHGSFASIEEIMNVEGIKEGTFSKIKDEIVV